MSKIEEKVRVKKTACRARDKIERIEGRKEGRKKETKKERKEERNRGENINYSIIRSRRAFINLTKFYCYYR